MSLVLSNESTGSNFEKKWYAGLANFKILAVNPNKAEFKDILNIDLDTEPSYVGTNANQEKEARIIFHVECTNEGMNFRTRIDYTLTNKTQVSTGGNKMWCNSRGTFQYESTRGKETMKWFWDSEGLREAFDGEREMIEMLSFYFNQTRKTNHIVQLNHIPAMFNGDFSEIKNWLCPENKLDGKGNPREVKMFCGIKPPREEGGKYYQTVWNKAATWSWTTDDTKIIQELENAKSNSKGAFKNIYFGQSPYKLVAITDPSKLEFFTADDPSKLVGAEKDLGLPF